MPGDKTDEAGTAPRLDTRCLALPIHFILKCATIELPSLAVIRAA